MIRVIVIGLIAGWIAGKLMRGRGYGAIADIVLGLIGAVIGSALFRFIGIVPAMHPFGSLALLAMATVGAVILVGIAHLFGGHAARLPAR
ncbi:MAG: GlsB/YeaQ/YmgE family stress response membrane protein [Candidatus Acidiferrales bacterium]